MSDRVSVGSVPIDPITNWEVVSRIFASLDRGQGGLLVTPNLDIVRLLQRDEHRDIINAAEIMVCDGAPVLWAARLSGQALPERVTGADLIWTVSEQAAQRSRSVYVLGGPAGASRAALERLRECYPGLRTSGSSAPQLSSPLTPAALSEVVATLKAAEPDIVFACFGFPKQERLAIALRDHLPQTWFIGCGAAVEFVAGTRRRAPRWLQRRGLEWVYRLWQEPRRLGPRYAQDAAFGARLLLTSAALGVGARLRTARVAEGGPSERERGW